MTVFTSFEARFAPQVVGMDAVRVTAKEDPRCLASFDLMESREDIPGTKLPSFEDTTMERLHGRVLNEEAAA